jgi:hypothetical protein
MQLQVWWQQQEQQQCQMACKQGMRNMRSMQQFSQSYYTVAAHLACSVLRCI